MFVCAEEVGESCEDEVFFFAGVAVEECVRDVRLSEEVDEFCEAARVLGVCCGCESFVEGGMDCRRDAIQEEVV